MSEVAIRTEEPGTASNSASRNATTAAPAGRIPELDGLRGLAILLVILCHYVGNAKDAPLGNWPHRFLAAFTVGWSGVDLFFVLSGFLIGGILLDAREAPHYFKAFYLRRVHRILPIYYSWTALYGLIVLAALTFNAGRTSLTAHDLLQLPIHFLFLQNMHSGLPHFAWIWFAVTWSLAVEEQFYLLAPPLIRFLSSRHILLVLVATMAAAPVFRLLVFRFIGDPVLATFPMPGRADSLALGILLAMGWRRPEFQRFLASHRELLQLTVFILLVGVLALCWWLAHPVSYVTLSIGYTWLALFFGGLLLLAVSQTSSWPARLLRLAWLRALGTISYCVYIIHDTINLLAHRVILHGDPEIYNLSGVGVTLLALGLTFGIAALSWRYFEKPLIRRGHRYSYA